MNFVNLLTKKQVTWVYGSPEVPKKGKAIVLPERFEGINIVITLADTRSTYDEKLYRCEHVAIERGTRI